MTPADIQTHLRRRFLEYPLTVDVSLEKLTRGEALAVRWTHAGRLERGCLFTATETPLEDIIMDVEAELARKERGA